MKRKILVLIFALVATSFLMTGCFFGTSDTPSRDSYELEIKVEGEGRVASLSEGTHEFEKDVVVDLVALPDSGWEFYRWIGSVSETREKETSIVMDQNRKVTVIFEKDGEVPDDPDKDVSFTYERIGTRNYKFIGSEPKNARYWEWKFPDLNYWRGKVDSNTIEHKFSSSGTKQVILEIYDEDENKIGRYEKTIDVH